MLQFRLFGQVQVEIDEEVHDVASARVRGTLASLLLAEGRFVPVSCLIESVWEEPPKTAASNLRLYVSRLRGQLDQLLPGLGERVVTSRGNNGGAYGLRVHSEELDIARFRRLAARGCADLTAGSFHTAEAAFTEALALWRGPAGHDCAVSDQLRSRFAAMDDLQLTVRERLTQARIGLGRSTDLVPEIHDLLSVAPFREASWCNLVRACYLGGDLAGAFDGWRRAISVLGDGLGLDPSADLRALHGSMLRRDDATVRAG